jgi:Ricin-type beta-trefoil lectin domain
MECTRLRQRLRPVVSRLVVGVLLIIGSLAVGASPYAVAADTRTSEALKMITDTAAQICESVPLEQSANGVTLSGDAQAKLGGLVGRIANLGLSGAGQYHSDKSTGVLQKDLSLAIQNANNCKLQVFQTLERDLIGSNGANNDDQPTIPGPAVTIISEASGKCLGIPGSKFDHTLVEQDTCDFSTKQRWVLSNVGYAEIINQYSGKCIDIPWGSSADQTLLQLYSCQGSGNQLWLHNSLGELISSSTGKCIDLPSASTADHIVVQQAGCVGDANQRWRIQNTGS